MNSIRKIGGDSLKQTLVSTAAIFLLTVHCIAQVNPDNNKGKPVTGYAPVNGLKLYYEIYGQGRPLVLIHGSFMTINTAFGGMIPKLAANRQVIAIELQGHGRTADIDRPFTFESMADDIAALLKYLKVDSTDLLGYSLGGAVALQVAIRHSQLIRKLIIISTAFKFDGWTPETRAIFPMLAPAMFEGSPIKNDYDSLAPDPKHWPVLVEKLKQLIAKPYDFSAGKIKSIRSPVLIISGDGDGVLPEHSLEIFRLLGGRMMPEFSPAPKTQLAMLPGTSHISVMMHVEWLLSMTEPFLGAPLTK